MKLNPDCIRDILLEVEDFTTLDKSLLYEPDGQDDGRFGQYDPDQIAYHVRQCALSNLICDYREFEDNSFLIGHLSPAGHALLADIRSDTIWNHTKSLAGKIGAWSLDALTKIATGVVTEMIKQQIG